MTDKIVEQWAQERLLSGPLSINPDAAGVWDVSVELAKTTPTNDTIDKWVADVLVPPLSHDTRACNQLRAAAEDLKTRLAASPAPDKAPAPAKAPTPAPQAPKEDKE